MYEVYSSVGSGVDILKKKLQVRFGSIVND